MAPRQDPQMVELNRNIRELTKAFSRLNKIAEDFVRLFAESTKKIEEKDNGPEQHSSI